MQNHELSAANHSLELIRASAGSGKTHHLTGAYIRLLFESPDAYRHILAVTFTNKATEEMKSRILQELNNLATGEKSEYLKDLMQSRQLSEEQIRNYARQILQYILHDYSAFSISTIDGFFQRTMRSFTREMGLTGGYKIDLNQDSTLTEIIDLMLFELDKKNNKVLSDWLLEFMKQEVANGKSWDIKKSIGNLAKQIFNEIYKTLTQEEKEVIEDKSALFAYRKKMRDIVNEFESKLKEMALRGLTLMDKHGLTHEDFKYGKNSGVSILHKHKTGIAETPGTRFYNLRNNIDVWFTKNCEKETIFREVYQSGLNDNFCEICEFFDTHLVEYQSAKAILNYFFTLGILSDIQRRLTDYQKENNTLFLSDTTELLNQIIKDDETPFVYEKLGTRFHHFMIDEFQDTSGMQWHNFRPLLKESLGYNKFNLIVGDVKQSIYRWRNTDWKLLEEQVGIDFPNNSITELALETNWRSDKHIIDFNNAFFRQGTVLLQEQFNETLNPGEGQFDNKILDAYRHVYQHVPENKTADKGYVSFEFIEETPNEKFDEIVAKRIPLEIEKLQDNGFQLQDIAILVRTGAEAVLAAETLLQYSAAHPDSKYKYDFISNEALLLSSAQSVKTAIALLRYYQNRKDAKNKMITIHEFYRLIRKIEPETNFSSFKVGDELEFPEEFRTEIEMLDNRPLYEMTERFFGLISAYITESDSAYIQSFMDSVLRFSTRSSSDIYHFLNWWDTEGKSKKLFLPQNQNAIRILTIHKSKGLDFGVVLLPFLTWNFDHAHETILWCKPKETPFNEIPIVPIRYSSSLANTIFVDEYFEEKLYAYIDNLNLLYVAFTRAKHRLIGFAKKSEKAKSISNVGDLIWAMMHQQNSENANNESLICINNYFSERNNLFEFGNPIHINENKEKKETGELINPGKWHSTSYDDRLRMQLNSIGYFTDDGSRNKGKLMHDIMMNIVKFEDIDNSVKEKVLSGELQEKEEADIKSRISELLQLDEVKDWYSSKYEVLNETQVLHPTFGLSRPDRVMLGNNEVIIIDYKFGEIEESKHLRQVAYYKKYIEEMGYQNVSGYLLYANNKHVVKI